MSLQQKILNWYYKYKRELPWRNTCDPYKIWVSEIILQQTRVNQGLNYYIKFISRFPDVKTLAEASIDEVMLYWKGLGYYSRARNMHASAQYIVLNLNSKFPDNYTDLLKLKGIGEYTAAAISSIAFNETKAVVDGNVIRVYSRLFNVDLAYDTSEGKKEFEKIASEMLNKKQPGDHNQAIMEFGALQCTPINPDCSSCVLQTYCKALALKKVSMLPTKQKKPSISKRYFYFIVLHFDNTVYIQKRKDNDIWHSLYQFPLLESVPGDNPENLLTGSFCAANGIPNDFNILEKSREMKHQLSHQQIIARFFHIKINSQPDNKNFIAVEKNEMGKYALPRLIDKYWNEYLHTH